MKRISQITSILFASILAASALAGCGDNGGGSSAKESSSGVSGQSATDSSSEASKADGPAPTITWYQAGDKAQDHDLVMEDLNKKIEEKIHAKLDLQMVANGEFNDKMKLISTSGENYDLTFTSSWRNSFVDNIARDAFLPLDDLYEQYGKEIKASIPEWLLTPGRSGDGKLYAIPNQQTETFYLGFYVQKEYADKYGFDLTHIGDIHEVEPFLQKLVENEPDKIPIDMRNDATIECNYELFMNSLLYLKIGDDSLTIKTREEVEGETPLRNEWYKKGFIRKDILTALDTSADIKANRYICSINAYKPGGDAEKSASSGVQWIAVPIGTPYVRCDTGIGTMTAINVNSKNPETAMQMINLVYTDKEIFNEMMFGLENVHYTIPKENHVEPVANTKYNYGTFAWAFGNQFLAWYLPGQEDGTWEKTDEINRSATVSPLRGFAFDPTPVQAELAQLSAVDQEYLNRSTVADDYLSVVKERGEKDRAAGLDTVKAEFEKQMNEWLKANGKK